MSNMDERRPGPFPVAPDQMWYLTCRRHPSSLLNLPAKEWHFHEISRALSPLASDISEAGTMDFDRLCYQPSSQGNRSSKNIDYICERRNNTSKIHSLGLSYHSRCMLPKICMMYQDVQHLNHPCMLLQGFAEEVFMTQMISLLWSRMSTVPLERTELCLYAI
jgi:hypothetical protein